MKGFTLVELLVVIAITAMLTGIAITYTNIGQNETALSVEAAKEAGFILNAKNLSLATYQSEPQKTAAKICAYGMMFNVTATSSHPANTYSLFAYAPFEPTTTPAGRLQCPSVGQGTDTIWYGDSIPSYEAQYRELPVSSSTWNVPVATGVKLVSGGVGDDLRFVLFYPPYLTVFMSNDGIVLTSSTSRIYLATVNGSATDTITVNSVGQVDF